MKSGLLPITTAINPRELGGLCGFNKHKIKMQLVIQLFLVNGSQLVRPKFSGQNIPLIVL